MSAGTSSNRSSSASARSTAYPSGGNEALDAAVAGLLAKDPAARHGSAASGGPLAPDPPAYGDATRGRRSSRGWSWTLAVLAALIAVLGVANWELLRESGGSGIWGGVKEAPSETVPAGVILAQDPPAGSTLEPHSYVYITTSVGPPEETTYGYYLGGVRVTLRPLPVMRSVSVVPDRLG